MTPDGLAFTISVGLMSLGAGVLGGMLGMAGGIFVVPALTLFFDVPIHHAVGASLISVIACSCGSAASAMEHHLANVRLAILLEIGTTLGALTGVALAGVFSPSVLYFLFSMVLILSAYEMLQKARRGEHSGHENVPPDRWAEVLRLNSSYPDSLSGAVISYRVARVKLGLVLMYFAGAASSLLGIGSGVLKVPAMDSALRLPIKVSSATSNFMIGVTGAASAGIYYVRGDVILEIAAPVALGSLIGAYLGTLLLARTPSERVRALFIMVLLGLAIKMFLTAIQGGD